MFLIFLIILLVYLIKIKRRITMKKFGLADIEKLKKFDMECCSIDCIKDTNKILSYLDDFIFNIRMEIILHNDNKIQIRYFHDFINEFFKFIRETKSEYSDMSNESIYKEFIDSDEDKIDDEFIRCSMFQLIKSEYSEFVDWYIDECDYIYLMDFNKYNIERHFYDIEIIQNYEPKRSRHVYVTFSNKCDCLIDINCALDILVSIGYIDKKEVNSVFSMTSISEDEYLAYMIDEYNKAKIEDNNAVKCTLCSNCDCECDDKEHRFLSIFPFDNKKDLAAIYGNHNIIDSDLFKYVVDVNIAHTNEIVKLLFIIGRDSNYTTNESILLCKDMYNDIILNICKTVVGYDGTISKVTKISKYLSLQAAASNKYSAKYFLGVGCIQDEDESYCIGDELNDKCILDKENASCDNNCSCKNKINKTCCNDCDISFDCECNSKNIENSSDNVKESNTVDKTVRIPIVPVDAKAEILTLTRLIGDRLRYLIGDYMTGIKITATCNLDENSPTGYNQHVSIDTNAEMDL